MEFFIGAQAQNYAEQVRSLLCGYSAAAYGPMETILSMTSVFGPPDLERYTKIDQRSVSIRGTSYLVSGKAAATVVMACPIMDEMMGNGVSDPAATCSQALGYILSSLRDGRIVTITLTDPWKRELTLSTPGKEPQAHHTDTIYISCLALEIADLDMIRLQDAIRLDCGYLLPS